MWSECLQERLAIVCVGALHKVVPASFTEKLPHAVGLGETRGLCGKERRPSLNATLACERLPFACPVLAWSRASPSVARARAAVASTRSDHQGHVVLCLLCVVFRVPRSCACFVLCMIGHLTLEVRHRQGVVYRQHVVGNARPDGNLLSSRANTDHKAGWATCRARGPQSGMGNLPNSRANTAHKPGWVTC